MKILFVYPEYPETFWSFKHALKFISKKAGHPPLGLLTVAAMLPKHWDKKLIDLNIEKLADEDICWADYVFISAMSIQQESAKRVIARCQELGTKIVAGGPLFTTNFKDFPDVNHLLLGEAENTLPLFLEDLEKGRLKHLYSSAEKPNIQLTPPPLWELANMKKYASMGIQYSRGCPFNCDFCNVTALFGRKMRLKTKGQILTELENLYSRGWRGSVFFVDDNFIGNKSALKKEILPAIIYWEKEKKYPFSFNTQASINLADDEELMRLMADAGFGAVFVGIETPNQESLAECGKLQNKNRDLIANIRKIQKFGLEVRGGFILGFDSDPSSIFDRMILFIQKSGIATAMVGLLNAPNGTKLYQRLVKENRIIKNFSGDNTDFSINFITKMDRNVLLAGYQKVVSNLYSPKQYYERVKILLKNFTPPKKGKSQFHFYHIKALVKSVWFLGIREKSRKHYWKLIVWSLFRRPKLLPLAITLSIYGSHFRKIFAAYGNL
ncbi:B12-binding domain-containing radical SAM protein [Patescibacteria group bacterium]|nr:B12-binding domain-containing radical SAM protein [Patescibacteria group bacterium]MBU4512266.1 B12-binding domain-containing radical SAM protein [Patescibacteria group bacterium]MCG2692942.1 B12-binding domain-containing radical SAM protein [Candidatus Parcubacteria bacterium]